MAYHGGYGGGGGGAQRPYGPGGQQPPGRSYGEAPRQQQYDNYGYDDGSGGQQYQGYGGRPAQPPAADPYGPGRPAPQFAREGPGRPATADGVRGGQYPPRGRGGAPGPPRGVPTRPGHMDRSGHSQGHQQGQYSPSGEYGARQPPPNRQGGPSYDSYSQDSQLAGQMGNMALNGDGRRSYETQHSHDTYGQGGGYGYGYDQGYNNAPQGGARNDFGPPQRSVTMPVNDYGTAYNAAPPPPPNAHAGRGMPHTPSPAPAPRLPAQTTYSPASMGSSGYDSQGGVHSSPYGNGIPPSNSIDDVMDSYYDSPRGAGQAAHGQQGGGAVPMTNARGNFEQPQPGAIQTPSLHNAQAEATFHEPQAAVFEMAGDIPSVPPMPHHQPNALHQQAVPQQPRAFQPEYNQGYGSRPAHEQLTPRGPSAPPATMRDPRVGVPFNPNPDSLPSHPTPVRPGLMPNSTVNMNNRPPPVRNYGGVPPSQPPMPQHRQQYSESSSQQSTQFQAPQQQQQQQPPQPQPQRAPAKGRHGTVKVGQFQEPITPQELEQLRMSIKANSNDQPAALRLAQRLIEAADVLAPNLPDPKQRARARERYLLDAHKVLKKLASSQNSDAMFILADSFGKGLFGNEPDNKEAFTLYQSAAKLGHPAAAYRTAVCCEIGHEDGGGTRRDPMKAMQWYKRASSLGDPPAMYKVGMILLKGLLGQQRNPREAKTWLHRAAECADAENPHALHELGLLYESARGNDVAVRDEAYALSLFQQAADLGYKFSQFRLGLAFEQGHMGLRPDPRQSIYWYSQAATQEEHQSELALSGWYLTGSDGVLGQSDTEAYLWARKAAVAGLAKAEYAMGYFTEVGIGVVPNMEDAKRWYWRAAAQDFPKARDRLEELKRAGKNSAPRPRERISRSRIERQQDGDCTIM